MCIFRTQLADVLFKHVIYNQTWLYCIFLRNAYQYLVISMVSGISNSILEISLKIFFYSLVFLHYYFYMTNAKSKVVKVILNGFILLYLKIIIFLWYWKYCESC